ncbi:hypothetical protein PWEIH_07031 [Listeria weihenstephanensis FSL R9-0317]|uniref:Bacterial Ig domain-containing protein n=1 Tax=Listeria weihenstephanensis TaxID=1006155 RepID=A0A1S7FXT7_9LIST|nr:right-handed parallel beta-helix repeat-containing protein [Listeria weihenstephanensis]AQY52157.1 hypothetical protein UE46_14770 [Listeria weihenstephanensis]EUJ39443.1 hypothetical protein PWEIH_07031 [Listeria weihenstephanensis FSL R9-0317]
MAIKEMIELINRDNYVEGYATDNQQLWNTRIQALEATGEDILIEVLPGTYFVKGSLRLISKATIQTTMDSKLNPTKEKAIFIFGLGTDGEAGFSNLPTSENPNYLHDVCIQDVRFEFMIKAGNEGISLTLDYTKLNFLASPSLLTITGPYVGNYTPYKGMRNISIRNVEVDGKSVGKNGFNFGGIENLRVIDCDIKNIGYLSGISLEFCHDVILEGNQTTNTGRAGIQIYRGNEKVSVINNKVTDWMQRYGVYHYYSVNDPKNSTEMFDGGIDSYGPNNTELVITGNHVTAGWDEVERVNNAVPKENPCNPNIIALHGNTAVNPVDVNTRKNRPLPTTPHTLYLPYRLSGASNVRLQGNTAKVRSVHIFGFLFAAQREVSKNPTEKAIGEVSDVVVTENMLELEGEIRLPLRTITVKKRNNVERNDDGTSVTHTRGIGLEILDNDFYMKGIINGSGQTGVVSSFTTKPRFMTIRLGEENGRTVMSEEVVLHNNRIYHQPLEGYYPEKWAQPDLLLVASPENIGDTVIKHVAVNNNRLTTHKKETAFETVLNERIEVLHKSLFVEKVVYDDVTPSQDYQSQCFLPICTVELHKGNVKIDEASVNSQGTFLFSNIATKLVERTATYSFIGKDIRGNQVEQVAITFLSDVSITTDTDYTIHDTQITGTYGTEIYAIKLQTTGMTKNATLDGTGRYAISVEDMMISPGDILELIAIDRQGVERYRLPVRVLEAPLDYTLTGSDYTLGTDQITGTFGRDIRVVSAVIRNIEVPVTITGINTFQVTGLAAKNIRWEDTFILRGKGVDDEICQEIEIQYLDYGMTVVTYVIAYPERALTGTHGHSIAGVSLWIDGKEMLDIPMDGNGNYTLKDTTILLTSVSKEVEIVGRNEWGQEASRIPVIMSSLFQVTAQDYTIGETATFAGTYSDSVFKVRLWVNGEVVEQAATDGNGNYTFAKASTFIKTVNDIVEIVGVNKVYQERVRLLVRVNAPKDYSLTTSSFVINQSKILTGTFGKDIQGVRLCVNGVNKTSATLSTDGSYRFENAAQHITNATLKVEVQGVDGAFVERKRIPVAVTVWKDYDLKVETYPVEYPQLLGTYGKDIVTVQLWVNGVNKGQATNIANQVGKYSFMEMRKYGIATASKVEVRGLDATKKVQVITPVVVKPALQATLTAPANYKLGTKEIAGACGKDIAYVRFSVNAVVKQQATIDRVTNKYKVTYANNFISATTNKVEIIGLDKAYVEMRRVSIPVIK